MGVRIFSIHDGLAPYTMKPLPPTLREFIDAAHVCRIATVRPDGRPHVIPVCPVFDGERLYVDIGDRSTTADGVRESGFVTVLIDYYDDDWSKLKAALLYCRARVVEGDERERAWAMIREKYPQYSTVDWQPRLTLALEPDDWRQWGFEGA